MAAGPVATSSSRANRKQIFYSPSLKMSALIPQTCRTSAQDQPSGYNTQPAPTHRPVNKHKYTILLQRNFNLFIFKQTNVCKSWKQYSSNVHAEFCRAHLPFYCVRTDHHVMRAINRTVKTSRQHSPIIAQRLNFCGPIFRC